MSKGFHTLVDESIKSYQVFEQSKWQVDKFYTTTLDLSLTYRFFTHVHPYVLPLVHRLNEGGIRGLQDTDTLYLPQGLPAKPLTVVADSTRAMLLANVTATRPDGTSVALTAGTPFTLPHNVNVTIPAGSTLGRPDGTTFTLALDATVALPGRLPVSIGSGIQWTVAGGEAVLPDNSRVTLAAGAAGAVLVSDGSTVTLPGGSAVALRSGLPQPVYYEEFFSRYAPDSQNVTRPYPVKEIDFAYDGAYSLYNWELFFHIPLMIAIHLSQNQKFQDAQTWFHYIFNPTDNSPGPTPERFWKVKPFQYTDVRLIEQILVNLSTNQDPQLHKATVDSIANWKSNPFQPFAVAQYRPTSFMLKTVMAYLDNLIAWGDSLFQQYTIETINEATQIYVMAANILGPKPQKVPKKGSTKPLTYDDLRGKLDEFGNTMVDMEVDIPFDIAAMPAPPSEPQGAQILGSIGQTLYFCVPRNDKLLAYWDTVADRLFKIHNSLNLRGVFQRLPLYEPPIDPALLVRAAAAGLDVSAVVSGLNQPLPLVRFQLLVGKAIEICQEVKSLGANIIAVMEKQDNESLAMLRSQHEKTILGLAEMVKYGQWQEAIKGRQSVETALNGAVDRYAYYQKLLGRSDEQIRNSVPALADFDAKGLAQLKFTQDAAGSEPAMTADPTDPDIADDSTSVSDGDVKTMSTHEVKELDKLALAHDFQIAASLIEALGAGLAIVPQFKAHAQPLGCGATVDFGGQHLHSMASSLASISKAIAEQYSYEANKAAKVGVYSRREQEWTFQSNGAKAEINHLFKQLRAAQIHEAVAQREYDNHKKQMDHAEEIVEFLDGSPVRGYKVKTTTIGFYAWMKRELKAVYNRAFQLAFEVAKKAERALQNELGTPGASRIGFNYLDGTGGLLAGEKLLLDLKAMEMAYHDLNEREYELTRHVSLLQIDPIALATLRATGSCTFTMPEALFDLDCPGHYFRRIRSVAVTLPCVAGPYTSVNCTLSLQKSSIRTSTSVADGYARKGLEDSRFSDYYGAVQAIVTSSAQADPGLFDANLRDERNLPFAMAGLADSQWQLSLPADIRQFDFDTITDAIVHVRYTAREGGEVMRAAATSTLRKRIEKAQAIGSVCLFSVRHEFPTEWAKFKRAQIAGPVLTAELALPLSPDRYPFWAKGVVGTAPLKSVQLLAEMPAGDATVSFGMFEKADKTGKTDPAARNPLLGNLLSGKLAKLPLPAAVTDATHPPLTIFVDNNAMQNLWLLVTWGK
jgi:hypothetical protein